MATYTAWMTDAESGNERVYDFAGPEGLFEQPGIPFTLFIAPKR